MTQLLRLRVRVGQYALVEASGGTSPHRGGLGIARQTTTLADGMVTRATA